MMVLLCLTTACAELDRFVDPDRDTTLRIEYNAQVYPVGVQFRLYHVATVDAQVDFALMSDFARYSIVLRDDLTSDEWQTLADTLASYAAADQLKPLYNGITDASGRLSYPTLKPGLYLLVADSADLNDMIYRAKPTLIMLPNRQERGWWQYDVVVTPKWDVKPIDREDLHVIKVWDDSSYRLRPREIEVELYCDGVLHETVKLSQQNNWRYQWLQLDTRHSWSVVERKVPAGYTVTISSEGLTTVITNYRPADPPSDPKLPQTGTVWWPVWLLVGLGMTLFLLGWLRQRAAREHEDA